MGYFDTTNDTIINSTFYDNFTLNQTFGRCPSPEGSLISTILYAFVCVIGLFGNTLVIYVVLRFSKMKTVTNMYILNLAIADECFLIGIPFLLITMQFGGWRFGENMCKAYLVSTSITQFTSSIFLFIMSADRYIAVCHPISSGRFRTPFVSKIVSAVAWIASLVLILPIILSASTIADPSGKKSCVIEWSISPSGTAFTLYSLIFGFAIPVSLMLCCYCLVIRKLHTVGPKNKSKEKKRSHRKVTKLVLTVITVYVLCWLPYWISQVALIHSPPQDCRSRLEVTMFVLISWLGYSNSAMNPILYAFLSDNFKKSFMKACSCAAGKDINAQLQLENSFFPRFGKNRKSDKLMKNKNGNSRQTAQQRNKDLKNCQDPQIQHFINSNRSYADSMATSTVLNDQTSITYPISKSMMTTNTTTTRCESESPELLMATNSMATRCESESPELHRKPNNFNSIKNSNILQSDL